MDRFFTSVELSLPDFPPVTSFFSTEFMFERIILPLGSLNAAAGPVAKPDRHEAGAPDTEGRHVLPIEKQSTGARATMRSLPNSGIPNSRFASIM
jgi:hypothetical protein